MTHTPCSHPLRVPGLIGSRPWVPAGRSLTPCCPAAPAVTKSLSGAARATIDACRTLFIWLYCLHVGWERFHMLQVGGHVACSLRAIGACVYASCHGKPLPPVHRLAA